MDYIKAKRQQQFKSLGIEVGTPVRVAKASGIRKAKRYELVQAKRRLTTDEDTQLAVEQGIAEKVMHKLSFPDPLKVWLHWFCLISQQPATLKRLQILMSSASCPYEVLDKVARPENMAQLAIYLHNSVHEDNQIRAAVCLANLAAGGSSHTAAVAGIFLFIAILTFDRERPNVHQ